MGGATGSIEIIKILVEISIETCKLLKIFMDSERISYINLRILILIKVSLVGYWKSLIILAEINKHSGKFLLVWGEKPINI